MIEIRMLFGDWQAVSLEQAQAWVKYQMSGITAMTREERIAYINSRLKGITADILLKGRPDRRKMKMEIIHLIDSDFERVPIIPHETMEALKPLAVEIARLIAESGDMNREIRIDARGFYVFSPDAGYYFTSEDDDRIFQAEGGSENV